MEFVAAAGKRAKLRAGSRPVDWLREALGAEGGNLVGGENEPARLRTSDCFSLFARKQLRYGAGRKRRGVSFEGPLVKISRMQLEGNSGGFE
jgi:hypothetical protein